MLVIAILACVVFSVAISVFIWYLLTMYFIMKDVEDYIEDNY